MGQNYEFSRMPLIWLWDAEATRRGDQECGEDRIFRRQVPAGRKDHRVKARVKAHALRELMETKDRLLIMGHKLGDIDSFGASVGIYRIATALNKKAHIVINDVTSSVRPMIGAVCQQSGLSRGSVLKWRAGSRNGGCEHHSGGRLMSIAQVSQMLRRF